MMNTVVNDNQAAQDRPTGDTSERTQGAANGQKQPAAGAKRADKRQGSAPAPQAAQGRNARRGPREMSESEKKHLRDLLEMRLQNPFAERELYTALRNPGSRFVTFTNSVTNQIFRTIQDLDRTMNQLEREPALREENLDFRHSVEKEAISLMRGLVDLCAKVAHHIDRPNLLLDQNTRAALDLLARKSKKPAVATVDEKAGATSTEAAA